MINVLYLLYVGRGRISRREKKKKWKERRVSRAGIFVSRWRDKCLSAVSRYDLFSPIFEQGNREPILKTLLFFCHFLKTFYLTFFFLRIKHPGFWELPTNIISAREDNAKYNCPRMISDWNGDTEIRMIFFYVFTNLYRNKTCLFMFIFLIPYLDTSVTSYVFIVSSSR